MIGEYREGVASILTDAGIITGQTPVSTEQVAGTGGVVLETGGAEHPASTRSVARIIEHVRNAIGDLFWFLSFMEITSGRIYRANSPRFTG
jgi:hypothetical protein